jgi:hypothetical protein
VINTTDYVKGDYEERITVHGYKVT